MYSTDEEEDNEYRNPISAETITGPTDSREEQLN